MQPEQKTVFISYRRKPAAYIARAIFKDLTANGYDVFMDVEGIDAGDFGTIIDNQIKARAHFLLVLTAGTVGRFDEPKDWLRHEIEYAMEHERNIVPLMLDGFKYDKRTKKYLTGKLADLPSLNGLPIRYEYFDEGMERLRTRFLKAPEYIVTEPTPPDEQDEVERKIEEVAAQPPPTKEELSAEDYLNRGFEKEKAGALADALADYDEAIRLNPQYSLVYVFRGDVRGENGDWDGAFADYDEAIRINPENAFAYIRRGNAYRDTNILDKAIADYSEAISRNPRYGYAYSNRGNTHNMLGNPHEAIADFDEAIRLEPENIFAHHRRGITRQAIGDFDGAITDFDEAIRINPHYLYAYDSRAPAREAKGDLQGAISDYQKYIELGGGQQFGDQEKVEQRIRELQAQLKTKS